MWRVTHSSAARPAGPAWCCMQWHCADSEPAKPGSARCWQELRTCCSAARCGAARSCVRGFQSSRCGCAPATAPAAAPGSAAGSAGAQQQHARPSARARLSAAELGAAGRKHTATAKHPSPRPCRRLLLTPAADSSCHCTAAHLQRLNRAHAVAAQLQHAQAAQPRQRLDGCHLVGGDVQLSQRRRRAATGGQRRQRREAADLLASKERGSESFGAARVQLRRRRTLRGRLAATQRPWCW